MNRQNIILAASVASVMAFLGMCLFSTQRWHAHRTLQKERADHLNWSREALQCQRDMHDEYLQLLAKKSRQYEEVIDLLIGAARLNTAQCELLRLRGEVARLEDMDVALSGLNVAATRNRWKRVHQLQARLEETPAAFIPELVLASAEDLFAACPDPLVTDDDYRQALSTVRGTLEMKLVPEILGALKRFVAANAGDFPTNVAQLASCFDPPVDPALLARWNIVMASDDPIRLFISQKRIDAELDKLWTITSTGYSVLDPCETRVSGSAKR